MSTIGKTAIELLALLNAELRKHEICDDISVVDIYELPDSDGAHRSNWDADWLRASGTSVPGDCKRIFISAKYELQRQYHLLTDA